MMTMSPRKRKEMLHRFYLVIFNSSAACHNQHCVSLKGNPKPLFDSFLIFQEQHDNNNNNNNNTREKIERREHTKQNEMSYYPKEDVRQRQPEEGKEGKTTISAQQHFHREQVQHPSSSTAQVVQVVDPRPRYTPPAIGVPENDPGPIFLGPGNHAPMRMNCYRCQKEVLTDVERKSGTGNLMAAIVTFGISLLMCPIPDSYHFCRECNALIGVSKVM